MRNLSDIGTEPVMLVRTAFPPGHVRSVFPTCPSNPEALPLTGRLALPCDGTIPATDPSEEPV